MESRAAPAQTTVNNRILLIDDDDEFRRLVSEVLEAGGYRVWQARHAIEAFSLLGDGDPGLAIVDYRLPGVDGITWISKVREMGKQFPIVFLSGTWTDKKTFNWLRNILKVSLIVQKPIVPELFVQSIENILPLPECCKQQPAPLSYENYISGCSTQEAIQRLDDLIDIASNQQDIDEMKRLRRRLITQFRIDEARKRYLDELPKQWENFKALLSSARYSAVQNLSQVKAEIHKLKGTSGSYKLDNICNLSDRIESLLSWLDPSDADNADVLWLEVQAAVNEISEIIHSIQDGEVVELPNRGAPLSILLLDGERHEFLSSIKTPALNCQLRVKTADSLDGAAARFRQERFDAAVLNAVDFSIKDVMGLAKSMRLSQVHEFMPIAFIESEVNPIPDSLKLYVGAMINFSMLDTGETLEQSLHDLRTACEMRKPRILCIDDDEALTRLMEQILAANGFSVRTLLEPVMTLDVMDEYQPDLVLLDVIMPGIAGYDVCRMLKAHDAWKNVPIVFLTAKSDLSARSSAFHAGADDFLAKPVVADELITRVEAQLAASEHRGLGHDWGNVFSKTQFDRKCGRLIGHALLSDGEGVKSASEGTLAMISVDSEIGQKHGALAAEQVTQYLKRLLAGRFRALDVRGRYGPDRFVVYMPGVDRSTAIQVMTHLQNELREIWFAGEHGQSFRNELKFGVAVLHEDGGSLERLLDVCVDEIRTGSEGMVPAA